MALKPIDLDRGVTQRFNHARQLMVVAYADDPGIYYAPNGAPVDPEIAREAGFEVDVDLKERERRSKRDAALAAIDREYAIIPEGEIIKDTGDFRVICTGHGWYNVENADGDVMNDHKLREGAAIEFMDALRKGKEHRDGAQA